LFAGGQLLDEVKEIKQELKALRLSQNGVRPDDIAE